jgi:CheY-like chemotaxis protein
MAADGEQGFKSMITKPPHLVISDFNMPKMDGIAFLRAVRSYEPTRKAAFILLTGRADKELIERAQKSGVNNVIAKPFTIAESPDRSRRRKIEMTSAACVKTARARPLAPILSPRHKRQTEEASSAEWAHPDQARPPSSRL